MRVDFVDGPGPPSGSSGLGTEWREEGGFPPHLEHSEEKALSIQPHDIV